MADVTRRLLELLAQLQTGRRFAGQELSDRLVVSPRTLRRDVERLREYGYPVTTRPGPSGFYQLSAGRTLPPLVLDDDEAVATLLALALLGSAAPEQAADHDLGVAAERAFGKIDQFLPKRLRPKAIALRRTMEAARTPAPAVEPDTLAALGLAATRHEVVTFDYTSREGRTSRRRVEPYRQVHVRLRWYLLAWDLDRSDWRSFRLDRVGTITATASPFTPRPLPADSAAEYLRAELTAPRDRVIVTVAASAARIADALKLRDAEIEALTATSCRVTAQVDSFEWFILLIALTGAEFVIEEPPEFRRRGRELAQRLRAASAVPKE
ncbi:helix-turn-helix transcriptional regulator [Nocardia sp. NBC_00511]|uniref:helix-turn-helix transcriptional regulator n=1 Tax=Nocardia sp. NBC_00511 TaxID=2903591 RepID=UPI0030DE2442